MDTSKGNGIFLLPGPDDVILHQIRNNDPSTYYHYDTNRRGNRLFQELIERHKEAHEVIQAISSHGGRFLLPTNDENPNSGSAALRTAILLDNDDERLKANIAHAILQQQYRQIASSSSACSPVRCGPRHTADAASPRPSSSSTCTSLPSSLNKSKDLLYTHPLFTTGEKSRVTNTPSGHSAAPIFYASTIPEADTSKQKTGSAAISTRSSTGTYKPKREDQDFLDLTGIRNITQNHQQTPKKRSKKRGYVTNNRDTPKNNTRKKKRVVKKRTINKPPPPRPPAAAAASATVPKTDSRQRPLQSLPNGKWKTLIYFCTQIRYLGTFTSHEDAVVAYDAAHNYLLPYNKKPADFRNNMKSIDPVTYGKPYIEQAKKVAKLAVSRQHR